MMHAGEPAIAATVQAIPGVEMHTLEPVPRAVNAPISWAQLLGGIGSDVVVFLLAALPGVVVWISGAGPVTSRAIVGVALSAIVAGLLAIQKITGTDGLSMRLRSSGQIDGGL